MTNIKLGKLNIKGHHIVIVLVIAAAVLYYLKKQGKI